MNTQERKTAVTLLLIGGGAFVVYKLLQKAGLFPTKEEIEQQKQRETAIAKAVKETGQKPTKSDAQLSEIAETIYNDLRFTALDDKKDDAAYQVTRVQNDADVWRLIQLFGKRQEYFFGIPAGAKQTLSAFIVSNLSKAKVAAINDNYRRKKITFRF